MKTVKVSETTLETLIEGLQSAVNVCYNAGTNPEKNYPYATGYSQAVMQTIIDQLNELKSQTN